VARGSGVVGDARALHNWLNLRILVENCGVFIAWIFVSGYCERGKKILRNLIFVFKPSRKWLKRRLPKTDVSLRLLFWIDCLLLI